VTGRPADYLEPELEEAKRKIGDLAKTEEDLLTFALYPSTGKQFLKVKYGVEPMPDSVKPPASGT
jgi:pyruvate/oxaloacetate carboxyltransferase